MEKSELIAKLDDYISKFKVSLSGESPYEEYVDYQYDIVCRLLSNLDEELDDLVDKHEKYKKVFGGLAIQRFPRNCSEIIGIC